MRSPRYHKPRRTSWITCTRQVSGPSIIWYPIERGRGLPARPQDGASRQTAPPANKQGSESRKRHLEGASHEARPLVLLWDRTRVDVPGAFLHDGTPVWTSLRQRKSKGECLGSRFGLCLESKGRKGSALLELVSPNAPMDPPDVEAFVIGKPHLRGVGERHLLRDPPLGGAPTWNYTGGYKCLFMEGMP